MIYNMTIAEQCQHTSIKESWSRKKTDDLGVPKYDKNNWAKTIENVVLHLKLIRGTNGAQFAYVIRHHIKVTNIMPVYSSYLNLDKEMIARAPIADAKSNIKLAQ